MKMKQFNVNAYKNLKYKGRLGSNLDHYHYYFNNFLQVLVVNIHNKLVVYDGNHPEDNYKAIRKRFK
jgi:hypothetical protein